MNDRITPKERALLKGVIRRVFSRSDLRQQALARVSIEHIDDKRPRVTKWGYCESCGVITPRYKLQVDHILPVVPLKSSLDMLTWDQLVDNVWCDPSNLMVLDEACHKVKTKAENKLRREYKKK